LNKAIKNYHSMSLPVKKVKEELSRAKVKKMELEDEAEE
jgi:hypothetical protein